MTTNFDKTTTTFGARCYGTEIIPSGWPIRVPPLSCHSADHCQPSQELFFHWMILIAVLVLVQLESIFRRVRKVAKREY